MMFVIKHGLLETMAKKISLLLIEDLWYLYRKLKDKKGMKYLVARADHTAYDRVSTKFKIKKSFNYFDRHWFQAINSQK